MSILLENLERVSTPVERPDLRFFAMPRTGMGWSVVGLMAIFALMLIAPAFGPYVVYWLNDLYMIEAYLLFWGLFGLAAGVDGLVALATRRERSWLVWSGLLIGAMGLGVIGILLLVH